MYRLLVLLLIGLNLNAQNNQEISNDVFSLDEFEDLNHLQLEDFEGIALTPSYELAWVLDSILRYAVEDDVKTLTNRTVLTEFNNYGKPLKFITESFDSTTNSWSKSGKEIFTYYDGEHIHKREYSRWNKDSSRWDLSSSNVYFESGKSKSFRLITSTSDNLTEYFRSDGIKLDSVLQKVKQIEEEEYTLTERSIYAFDEEGRVVSSDIEYFSDGSKSFGRRIYDYEVDTTTLTISSRNNDNEEWMLRSKYVWNYEEGLLKERRRYLRDDVLDKWNLVYESIHSYTETGKQHIQVNSSFNWSEQAVVPINKYEYEYDENDNLALSKYYGYDRDNDVWVQNRENVRYWSQVEVDPSSLDEVVEKSFSVYPNPAQVSIELSHPQLSQDDVIEVFDEAGKQVYIKPSGSRTINVEHLQSGRYFIIIRSNSRVKGTSSFVKQ